MVWVGVAVLNWTHLFNTEIWWYESKLVPVFILVGDVSMEESVQQVMVLVKEFLTDLTIP